MTDEDTRILNRAIVLVEDQEVRELARTALHRVFRYQCKLEDEVERVRGFWEDAQVKHARAALEVERLRDEKDECVSYLTGEVADNNRLRDERDRLAKKLQLAYDERDEARDELDAKVAELQGSLADADAEVERLKDQLATAYQLNMSGEVERLTTRIVDQEKTISNLMAQRAWRDGSE